MSLQPITDRRAHEETDRLHERALAEAQRLRREAIDDFWRHANGLLGDAARSAQRAAVRLGQRLRRRDAGGTAFPGGMA
ncbi:MAG: hypothetical protein HZC37_00865 [Burkholderiales bacterium]|nr:hypothetical protein [Burkholderiales bacterium]